MKKQKKRKPLTKKQIEKLLKRGAKNAAALDEQLRLVFCLSDRAARLRLD